MKKVDLSQSIRSDSYNNFINYSDPIVAVTTRLDVTNLFRKCKNERRSFFIDFLYYVMKSINNQVCFKIRLVDGETVEYDIINPSFIVINRNNVISTCSVGYQEDQILFFHSVRKEIDDRKLNVSERRFNSSEQVDVVYISCMPWIDFTSFKNPYDYKDLSSTSVPRIMWGKVIEDGSRCTVAFDISANHAFVDGYDIAQYIMCLQNELDSIMG